MKERPILFSGPMVRAILEGRKTQTRRVVKPSAGEQARWLSTESLHGFVQAGEMVKGGWQMWHPKGGPRSPYGWIRCPYGQPGDRLWVRETIRRGPPQGGGYDSAIYAADGALTALDSWGWKRDALPAIHCPRGLSRITLEVTGVRVERLQDISRADALAEGVEEYGSGSYGPMWGDPDQGREESAHFLWRWSQLYGPQSVQSNPWVWVVSFKRVDARERAA